MSLRTRALTNSRDTLYFGAGPAMLPQAVLEQAHEDLFNLDQSGLSPLEIGHRSELFMSIVASCETHLRSLLSIPDNYRLLFMAGGATSQFALVPLNLRAKKAAYILSGLWSKKAAAEASNFCAVDIIASSEAQGFSAIPATDTWHPSSGHDYCYFTDNETIHGVEFHQAPEVAGVPLVADMTSSLLTKSIDITDYGVIFAATQKNLGCSGLCVVIVHEDLMQTNTQIPALWRYPDQLAMRSIMNTPPTYTWYIMQQVLQWNQAQGGCEYFAQLNQQKSERLYACLDASDFYLNEVKSSCRSRVNVSFALHDPTLQSCFHEQAESAGLLGLAGHRLLGGLRASLYNAMPMSGVERLVAFLKDFERRYG